MEQLTPYKDRLEVTFLYLSEAHARDEWPIGNHFRTDTESPLWTPDFKQSLEVETRLERVVSLSKRFNLPSWITLAADIPHQDTMPAGPFERIYGAWPTGFYVVDTHHTLIHVAEPKHGIFSSEPLMNAIRSALL